MSVVRLLDYFLNKERQHGFVPLKACAAVSSIYTQLPYATISTLVLSQNLLEAKWIEKEPFDEPIPALSRQQAFACISMFETGTCNLDPLSLSEVFAISSGSSIFVASALLVDPHEQPHATAMHRVVGNIGRAGLSLLVPPPRTKIRRAELGNWKEINHLPFDGTAENCFQNTSIHLSFTEYEMPLATAENNQHTIDRPINLIESLISVYDRGKWVADLDVLKAFYPDKALPLIHRQICNSPATLEEEQRCCCQQAKLTFLEASKASPQLQSTSVDNWEELLDPPITGTIVIRAHKNWLARLALSVVCVSSGFRTIILGNEACWSCCTKFTVNQDTLEKMPSVNPKRYQTAMLEHSSDSRSDSDNDSNTNRSSSSDSEGQESASIKEPVYSTGNSDEDSEDNTRYPAVEIPKKMVPEEARGEDRRIALVY